MPETRTNQQRLLAVVMAFQHFGGKSFRAIDAGGDAVTDQELSKMESALQKIAVRLRSETGDKELHKLSDQIEEKVGKMRVFLIYPEERWVEQEEIASMYASALASDKILPQDMNARTLPQMCAALEDAAIIAVGSR